MLFKDDYYNSVKCDLYGDTAYIYTERDVCEELSILTSKFMEYRDSRVELTICPNYINLGDIDEEKIEANFNDGILTIVAPKRDNEASKKLITIK